MECPNGCYVSNRYRPEPAASRSTTVVTRDGLLLGVRDHLVHEFGGIPGVAATIPRIGAGAITGGFIIHDRNANGDPISQTHVWISGDPLSASAQIEFVDIYILPEPAVTLLVVLGGAGLLRKKRRN